MKVPPAVKVKAIEEGVSFLDLWHSILTAVRDGVLELALRNGSESAQLQDAVDEVERLYPWLGKPDRLDTAWAAMSFGIGSKLWDIQFTHDGKELDSAVVRELIQTDGEDADLTDVVIEFPLEKTHA
jgi:hypothetical protein